MGLPTRRRRARTARALAAIDRWVDWGLLDLHVGPIGIQVLSQNHRERRLDTLADFRRLVVEDDRARWRYADIGVEHRFARGIRRGIRSARKGSAKPEGEHQACAHAARDLQKLPSAYISVRGLRFDGLYFADDVAEIGIGCEMDGAIWFMVFPLASDSGTTPQFTSERFKSLIPAAVGLSPPPPPYLVGAGRNLS